MLYELLDPSRLKDGGLEPNRGLLSLPEPRPGDLFFDIEGDPFALDDGDRLPLRRPRARPAGRRRQARPSTPSGRATRTARSRSTPRSTPSSGSSTSSWTGSTQDPSLHIYHYAPYEPTRARAADGPPRDARGRGRPAAARRRLRRPLPGRAPGRPRVGRELLDQEARAALRLHARGRPARRRLEHRRLRDVARGRRRGRPRRRDPRRDRALQPRRRRLHPGSCATGSRSGARELAAKLGDGRSRGRVPQDGRADARSSPSWLAARSVARAADGGHAGRREPSERRRAARAGSWPSSWPGTAARTRRPGGATST